MNKYTIGSGDEAPLSEATLLGEHRGGFAVHFKGKMNYRVMSGGRFWGRVSLSEGATLVKLWVGGVGFQLLGT
jgi:hypothetical protein